MQKEYHPLCKYVLTEHGQLQVAKLIHKNLNISPKLLHGKEIDLIAALFAPRIFPTLSTKEKFKIAGAALNPRFRRLDIDGQAEYLRKKFPKRSPWEVYPWGNTYFSGGKLRPLLKNPDTRHVTQQSVKLDTELQLSVKDSKEKNMERMNNRDREIAIELWVEKNLPKYYKAGWKWNDKIVHYLKDKRVSAYGDLVPPKSYYSRYRSLFRPPAGVDVAVGAMSKYDGRREFYADLESQDFGRSTLLPDKPPARLMESADGELAPLPEVTEDGKVVDTMSTASTAKPGKIYNVLYDWATSQSGDTTELQMAMKGDRVQVVTFSNGNSVSENGEWVYVQNLDKPDIAEGWIPSNYITES